MEQIKIILGQEAKHDAAAILEPDFLRIRFG
jgi:hypothetical protein